MRLVLIEDTPSVRGEVALRVETNEPANERKRLFGAALFLDDEPNRLVHQPRLIVAAIDTLDGLAILANRTLDRAERDVALRQCLATARIERVLGECLEMRSRGLPLLATRLLRCLGPTVGCTCVEVLDPAPRVKHAEIDPHGHVTETGGQEQQATCAPVVFAEGPPDECSFVGERDRERRQETEGTDRDGREVDPRALPEIRAESVGEGHAESEDCVSTGTVDVVGNVHAEILNAVAIESYFAGDVSTSVQFREGFLPECPHSRGDLTNPRSRPTLPMNEEIAARMAPKQRATTDSLVVCSTPHSVAPRGAGGAEIETPDSARLDRAVWARPYYTFAFAPNPRSRGSFLYGNEPFFRAYIEEARGPEY